MAKNPEARTGSLVYAGIDEAGYGPLLGPLCSGLVVMRCAAPADGDGPPDLWEALGDAVCRDPADAGTRRVPVGDSKRLKLSNSGGRHPLTHLERGVLSVVGAARDLPATDAALFEALGATIDDRAWYAGEPAGLPVSTTADHLRVLTARVGQAMADAGVELVEARARIVDECAFNTLLREAGDKAAVGMRVVAALASRVWRSEAARDAAVAPRIIVDRQGGRTRYAGELAAMFPGATVSVVAEAPSGSVYDVSRAESDGVRRVRIAFVREAEKAHFPVALASMIAKLTRELMMARFNRYWCERIAELKPTAGYVADGRRWVADVRRLSPQTPESVVRSLCRNA
jgi:ribonuclease HII